MTEETIFNTHVPFLPNTHSLENPPPRIKNLGVVGMGNVTIQRIWPAILSLSHRLDKICLCSIESKPRVKGIPFLYLQVDPGGYLQKDNLCELGLLGPDTAWIVATPSDVHAHYVAQLAPHARVASEKPLDRNSRRARTLLPFATNRYAAYSIDHKLFNTAPLLFIDRCRATRSILGRVRTIKGTFYESHGFLPGRVQEDCIADIQWHLLAISAAVFKAIQTPFKMTLSDAVVATHRIDPAWQYQVPKVWTASRVRGSLLFPTGREIQFDFKQAKGAPVDRKVLSLRDLDDYPIVDLDLNESGWKAHERVLDELLRPTPDMRHTLADAIAIMELVDLSRAIATEEAFYNFGHFPEFLLSE